MQSILTFYYALEIVIVLLFLTYSMEPSKQCFKIFRYWKIETFFQFNFDSNLSFYILCKCTCL